ncbi:MAG: butyrate kinase, partial [Desulfobacteraceae bacterium]
MKRKLKIFTINPGSTSTKVAMFENETEQFSSNVAHDAATLKTYKNINDQFDYRKEMILAELTKHDISLSKTDAFVGRGGGLVGLEGGTYTVNEKLLEHAKNGFTAKHPAILGSQLAHHFADMHHAKAFVVNPPDVDEFEDVARICGFSDIFRESRIHALNQKEIGIRYAQKIGKHYEACNLVIAHIGGGVSVTAHRKGRMIDSNDCINGDGPMAPTRAGTLPAGAVVKLCCSGKYTERDMYNRITKTGGLVDHLGTSDVLEIMERIEKGDKYARLVFDAMIYQIGKNIGACAAVLKGEVDAVVLTGGISNCVYLVDILKQMVSFIAPVEVYAGEFEM